MTITINLTEKWKNCNGVIPVFPLPDKVLLPQEIVPLHIFEPRYRKMLADTLASERLLGLALFKPGWENCYQSKSAPINETICVGYVAADQMLPDGRSLIIMQGLIRARVDDEPDTDLPYRVAKCHMLPDREIDPSTIDRQHRKEELLHRFSQLLPRLSLINNGMIPTDYSELSIGRLSDLLASTLSLPTEGALSILTEFDPDHRSELVLSMIKEKLRQTPVSASAQFPPPFSEN